MSAHLAYAHRTDLGPWRVSCPAVGCGYDEPASGRDHADYLADEHYRTASCWCFDPRSAEWSPTPCEACKETA